MLSGSIAVLFVLGFFSPVSGQSTTTLAPAASLTSYAMPHQTSNAGPPGTMSAVVQPSQSSTSEPPAQASTSEPPVQTSTPVAPPPFSTTSPSTSASVALPTKPSCASVSFIAERAWNASLSERLSALHNKTSEQISKAMEDLFNESSKYEDVKVSEENYSEKDDVTLVKVKLCLAVKTSDGVFIDAVFIDKVKTGYLAKGFQVRKDSAEFKPLGVEFKDWKAKVGECDKCEGAGGEFTIEGTCVPKDSNCKGLKNTVMTKDCVTYCDSSAGTYTVSFLILAIGIFFSFSFQ